MRTALTGRKALDVLASHGRNDWFRISSAAKAGTTDVWIYGEIGYFGTPASEFIDRIRDIDTPTIAVHLNSLGGDVFDGIAIFNALRQHPANIRTVVDSMAASIASVIAQAGNERIMVSHSQMMIHEAWGVAMGGAEDMRKYADTLERQTANIADIYAERSGRTAKYFRGLMADETWMGPDEALNHGLADEILTPEPAAAPAADDTPEPAKALVPAATKPDWAAIIAGQTDQEPYPWQ